ncbi:bifunctional nuclease family protein [Kosmotoga pacifica]|uniref:BFN domain-containing protein n=1 Tax=Kosmotoga pacifica TaxID=1330330 RepID=A0A0G2ZE92_9BACT|nr:bifunctional nuclease family protein [Kosmotoga pacifica]AKI97133.1 hypothetical protein IX53_04120 [Kosmotoga pacifica]
MLKVKIRGLALDQTNSPVVILEVDNSNRGFGIWIGPFEAESLALAVSGKEYPRPLTYDLFINTIKAANAMFEKAIIHSVKENIYYATLYLIDGDGEEKEIDARPSDCLVLAVKYGFPVYVAEEVFESSAIDLSKIPTGYTEDDEEESEQNEDEFKKFLNNIDIEDIKKYLEKKKGKEEE